MYGAMERDVRPVWLATAKPNDELRAGKVLRRLITALKDIEQFLPGSHVQIAKGSQFGFQVAMGNQIAAFVSRTGCITFKPAAMNRYAEDDPRLVKKWAESC